MHKKKPEEGLTLVNQKKIYSDMIKSKFPEKALASQKILSKSELSRLDIIRLNELIFGMADKETNCFNQNHRSYDEATILEILKYQKKYGLNNIEVAAYFKVSRNSISKWKKIFLV